MQKKTIEKMPKNTHSPISSKLSQAQEDKKAETKLKNSQQEFIATADQTPRFVACVSHDVENGNIKEYIWHTEKIFVHECLHDDVLMLQNVFEGKIISSLVYPLIFDYKSSQREIYLRSIEFYREVQSDPFLYHDLSSDEKGYFLIGVRDLFIAACRGMLSQDEKEILPCLVNLIDPNDNSIVFKTINNVDVAPYPTAVHKMVRFIEEGKSAEEDNNILDEYFVRNELGLLVGFVDPRDLSFHNFENIINLDSLFKVGEDFRIGNLQKHGNSEVYTFDLQDRDCTLLSLDKCGLYVQPLNKMSRGGERFIFASKKLGDNLTNSLQKYVSHKIIQNSEFKFVNYIFRYNKFKPGDRKFTSHLDTPYHDPARRLYSKYTLLLYLTPGIADPVLSFDNGKLKIDSIAANNGVVKGVIFDQKYEHEGKSFIDSDKIFLRSELIYSYSNKDLSYNADVSKRFNIACYMTKQSVFNPELEKYASDCFNQVAQARLDLANANVTKDVLLYKTYHGVPFITNGYDYWFLKKTGLRKAGIITLLDYFSATYLKSNMKEEGYATICDKYQNVDENISDDLQEITNVKDIFECLRICTGEEEEVTIQEEDIVQDSEFVESLKCDTEYEEKIETEFEETNSINDIEVKRCYYCDRDDSDSDDRNSDDKNSDDRNSDDSDYDEDDGEGMGMGVHPTEDELDRFLYDNKSEIRDGVMAAKEKFTVFIFNQEIKIETSRIQINDDAIVFNEKIPSVNFAGCQFDMLEIANDFTQQKLNLSGFGNIPPIPYVVHDEGYHLKIELFNNGFVRNEEMTFTKYYCGEPMFVKS